MTHPMHPPKQGLYDPRYEHDSCGVGFVVDLKGRKSHDIVEQAMQILRQPGAPRRLRLRDEHRRRRRHPDADAARLPGAASATGSASACRRRATTASAASSCRPTPPTAARVEELFEQIVREEGQTFLGWRDVPVDHSPLGQTARAAEPVIRQVFIGRGAAAGPARRPGLRAQALRHPQPRRERRPRSRTSASAGCSTSLACPPRR